MLLLPTSEEAACPCLERGRRTVGLFLGPLLAALTLALPLDALTAPQQRLAAVLVLCVTFWLTEAIPLPATGLLGPALAVLLGVATAKEAFATFGDPLLFLFVGSFMIAEAMAHHGLDRRIATLVLSRRVVSKSPARILVALGVTSAAISMWISNTATTAMMLPVALGVLRVLADARGRVAAGAAGGHWPFATGLILCISFSASVGGIGTPVGTPPNLIGMGMVSRLAGRSIGFFEWTTFAVPILLLVLPIMLAMLLFLHPPGRTGDTGAAEYFRSEHRRLGRMGRGEIAVALAFALAVTLWVLPGFLALVLGSDHAVARAVAERLPEGPASLAAAAVLFVFPVDWKQRRFACDWRLAARIDWGTVMLFGGGMALGSMMFSTGLAQKIGGALVGLQGSWSPAAFLAVAILVAVFVSEATSNTASVSMVVPVVIAIARQEGIDPVLPAIGACLGASFGFALPVSTAPNAMVYGTGRVPILKMVRAGLLLDLVGAASIWVMLMLIGPSG